VLFQSSKYATCISFVDHVGLPVHFCWAGLPGDTLILSGAHRRVITGRPFGAPAVLLRVYCLTVLLRVCPGRFALVTALLLLMRVKIGIAYCTASKSLVENPYSACTLTAECAVIYSE
jgi:hypothetical protein